MAPSLNSNSSQAGKCEGSDLVPVQEVGDDNTQTHLNISMQSSLTSLSFLTPAAQMRDPSSRDSKKEGLGFHGTSHSSAKTSLNSSEPLDGENSTRSNVIRSTTACNLSHEDTCYHAEDRTTRETKYSMGLPISTEKDMERRAAACSANTVCPVCLEEIMPNSKTWNLRASSTKEDDKMEKRLETVTLRCGHEMHLSCMLPGVIKRAILDDFASIESQQRCPLCRTSLSPSLLLTLSDCRRVSQEYSPFMCSPQNNHLPSYIYAASEPQFVDSNMEVSQTRQRRVRESEQTTWNANFAPTIFDEHQSPPIGINEREGQYFGDTVSSQGESFSIGSPSARLMESSAAASSRQLLRNFHAEEDDREQIDLERNELPRLATEEALQIAEGTSHNHFTRRASSAAHLSSISPNATRIPILSRTALEL